MWFVSPLSTGRTAFTRRRRPSSLRVEKLEDRCQPNAGALDPTFGVGGQVAASTSGSSVLVQPWDNRIVVAGGTALARYNPDGSLDTTFDGDGIATSPISISAAALYSQTGSAYDGNVVGVSSNTVARFTATGGIDTTFGTNGVVTLPWNATALQFSRASVVVQPDGKVVVSGIEVNSNTSGNLKVTRLNANGSIDTSFGASGTWQAGVTSYLPTAPVPPNNIWKAPIELQSDGRLIVSGQIGWLSPGHGWWVRRLTSNGAVDSTFTYTSTTFGATWNTENGAARPIGTAVYPSSDAANADKILTVGYTYRVNGGPLGGATVLARYNPDGGLDTTFGTGGKVITPQGGIPKGVAIQSDGQAVVITGPVWGTGITGSIQRYNTDGSLDTTFGDAGFVYTAYNGVAIQPDGNIVAANSTVVSRYLSTDGPPPPPPTTFLSINNVSATEGHAGTSTVDFTVTLSAASADEVTVEFITANGTAASGSDYSSTGGTLIFAPGETSKTISIPIIGDRLGEADETFFVNLRNAVNAGYADNQGAGTIFDDEPRMTISDVALTEGKSGTKAFVFTVTLSAAYDETVSVSFQTNNGTATTSNNDYIAQSGSLTFNPGETSKTITIMVKGDKKRESNEEFYVDLFGISSNALLLDSRGVGTILNDD